VAGAAGETTRALTEKGVPALVMADGPAGLRLSREYTVDEKGVHPLGETMPESMAELMPAPAAWFLRKLGAAKPGGELRTQYASAIPIGTALAQSWNIELAEACGDVVGDEMERFGVHLWLAPALNLHRDIRCGRNFEYFSEDPLISGRLAAALTRGVQRHPGCGVTVKHFAANNQERNRYGSNSQISERALRELYLRGFGICVRESAPAALMTSYNLLNGVHTSQRRDLLQHILRCEFGFGGLIMTDWVIPGMSGRGKYGGPDRGKVAAAGNDVFMPGSWGDHRALLKALRWKRLTRHQLRINATRVLRTARKLTEARAETV
jgi:beta-glucosidase